MAANDPDALANHTRSTPTGIMRPPTSAELSSPEVFFRPDAVLNVVAKGPALDALSPFEQHVAAFLDGIRPVARVRTKTGLSTTDLAIAISLLRDQQAIEVCGIIEDAVGVIKKEIDDWEGLTYEQLEQIRTGSFHVSTDEIDPAVLRELEQMAERERSSSRGNTPAAPFDVPFTLDDP